jgi:hypothetical protein
VSHTPDPNSTFTTNFDFEKAPIDSFEDTWADLINDNLDLIDAAIAAAPVINAAGSNRSTMAIDAGDVIYSQGGGMWTVADSDDANIMTAAIAIATSSTTGGGEDITVQEAGPVAVAGLSGTPGMLLYVGASGAVSTSPGQYPRAIGTAIGGTGLLLNTYAVPMVGAHAAAHGPAGSDPLALDDLAAPGDNTDLNVSTTAHGLAPKLPNDDSLFLAGDGVWRDPAILDYYEADSSATIDATAAVILADATAADVVLTLPGAQASAGRSIVVKKIDSTAHTVTIAAASGETIDGAATKVLTAEHQTIALVAVYEGPIDAYRWAVTVIASGTGDIVGPSSSTDNALPRFDGTGGKTLQGSLVTVDDSGSVNIPSGQSYKVNGTALAASNVGALPTGTKLDDLSAPDDNTDLNASTTAHGLLPKLNGNTDTCLQGDGTWGSKSSSGGGDVTGPSSSTDNAITRMDGASGKVIQNSLATVDDSGNLNLPSGAKVKINNVDLAASDVGAAASSHNHDSAYVSVVSSPTTGNLAALTAGGEISDSGSAPDDFAAADHNHSGTYEPAITTLPISKGGTGTGTAPSAGQVLIGKTDGSYAPATLTEGTNVTITEGDGTITIAASGGGGSATRVTPDPVAIAHATSDAAAGKTGTIDLTANHGLLSRIRVRSDFIAGQQTGNGSFLVNNASGIAYNATTIAIDTASTGLTLADGDLVRIDGEIIKCGSGTSTSSIANATRGYAGTVATYHDDNVMGVKANDGLRLELYPNSSYNPKECLLTLREIMTGKWTTDANITASSTLITLAARPTVVSDFGLGSLILIDDTVDEIARVQDVYGDVADAATDDSIRTMDALAAHTSPVDVYRLIEFDVPIAFKFATSATTLYLKLFVEEKTTATVTATVDVVVEKFA